MKIEERTAIVNLPKLKITKLEGTLLNWFQFWNQFKNEIDEADLNPVSK